MFVSPDEPLTDSHARCLRRFPAACPHISSFPLMWLPARPPRLEGGSGIDIVKCSLVSDKRPLEPATKTLAWQSQRKIGRALKELL